MESTKHNYQLFEKKIQDEIKGLMKGIKSQVLWLERHCMQSIYRSEDLFDLSELVFLKECLDEIAEDLAVGNEVIVGHPGYSLYLLESDPDYREHIRASIEKLANQD